MAGLAVILPPGLSFKNMKRLMFSALLLVSLAVMAQTPSQLLNSAAAWQALSDRELNVVGTYELARLNGSETPASAVSNSVPWAALSDRDLQIVNSYFLGKLSAVGTNTVVSFFSRSVNNLVNITNTVTITNGMIMNWQVDTYPLDFPNIALWLDASAITNADNSVVSTWYDKSGRGLNAVASGTGPTIKYTGLNSKKALLFTSTGTELVISSAIASRPFTAYAVLKPYASADNSLRIFLGDNGAYCWYLNDSAGDPQHVVIYDTANNSTTTVNGYDRTKASLFGLTHPAGGMPTNYVNGVASTFSAVFGNAGTTALDAAAEVIGGTTAGQAGHFNGHIAEVLVYTGVQSDAVRAKIEQYLRIKWALW